MDEEFASRDPAPHIAQNPAITKKIKNVDWHYSSAFVAAVIVFCCTLLCLAAMIISYFFIFSKEREAFHADRCIILECRVGRRGCSKRDLGGDSVEVMLKERNEEDEDELLARALPALAGGASRTQAGGSGSNGGCTYVRVDVAMTLKGRCEGDPPDNFTSINLEKLPSLIEFTHDNHTYCTYQKHIVRPREGESHYCRRNVTKCYYNEHHIYSSLNIDKGDPTAGGKAALSLFSFGVLVCICLCCCIICAVACYRSRNN